MPAAQPTDLSDYISRLPNARLIELVVAQADRDLRLHELLAAEARAAAGLGVDIARWRGRVEDAFASYDDYVGYHDMPTWAADVQEIIDALVELCEDHPDAVIVLAEHAHRCTGQAMEYVDDSNGELSSFAEQLGELHLRACTEGSPDPVVLARQLVHLELHSELDGFGGSAAAYADVLGETGLAEYRRLLEPQRRLLATSAGTSWSTDRYRARVALVGLAHANDDPDELIDVVRHDLRSPHDYVEIARALVDHGRVDEAIEWGHRGLTAFPERQSQSLPLRELLAVLLRGTGRDDEAVIVFWDAFELDPGLGTFRRLLDEVAPDTEAWRQRALALLRARLAGREQPDRNRVEAAAALIDVLLAEGGADEAWHVAKEHGCDRRRWLALAKAREPTNPLDAIDVYEPEVFAHIEAKNNDAYQAAVELLAAILRLSLAASAPERFDAALRRARVEHKAKRNLQALLDRKKWPRPNA